MSSNERSCLRSSSAASFRTASPRSWPCSSLIALKPSRSHTTTQTGSPASAACSAISAKRAGSDVRLSRPVSGSRADSERCCISAFMRNWANAVRPTAAATPMSVKVGSSANPAGSAPAVAASSTATVRASPAWTPRVEKRAGSVTSGSRMTAIAGLCGPPVTAMPAPMRTCALTTVAATTYSGRALVLIHGRSTL